jgi:type I restriction enzyme S subunit
MIKKYKLNDISRIISGYSFRSSVSSLSAGETFVIQLKDVCDDMSLDLDNVQKINSRDIETFAHAVQNDILLASKGKQTVGYVDTTEDLLVSSSLYIIRVESDILLSKYLAIYFKSIKGQRELNKISLGGYIKGISKKHLERMTIPVPPIDIQENIILLYDNISEQNRLLERKTKINKETVDYVINKLIF